MEQHAAKRRKLNVTQSQKEKSRDGAVNPSGRNSHLQTATTPKKNVSSFKAATPSKDASPKDASTPLSRTLGLFKKYHKPAESTSPSPTKKSPVKNIISPISSPSGLAVTGRSSLFGTARSPIGRSPLTKGLFDGERTPSTKRRRDDSAIAFDMDISPAKTPSQQDSVQAADEESDADEIIVRSSSRKRTVSEKLREVKHARSSPNVQTKAVTGRSPTSHKPKLLFEKENVPPRVDEIEPMLQTRTSKTPVTKVIAPSSLSESDLNVVKQQVLMQLTSRTRIKLMHLNEQYSRVSTLVEQTIASGESNSMLVIGPRGSGKTTMIEQIVTKQQAKHNDTFHVVRLNGYIHTDDKLALRDIWRQLGREMEIDNSTHSYADTMSMLLALLSHPLELEQSVESGTMAKSVIFILDEFDLFATHPRQTLLYNLFDIAQSRKAPIAVLGLTTRVDTVEQLEKRVKSRFSHRYVHLGLMKNIDAFTELCKASLCADVPAWDGVLPQLFETPQMQLHIKKLFYRTKSVPDFMASVLLAMSTLPGSEMVEHILTYLSSPATATTKLDNLDALSTMGTAMLVCAARQSIYSIEHVSFDLAYEEYKNMASKMKLQATASGALASNRVWAKEVAKVAWLELIEMGYVVDGRVDVSLTELAECGADLGQWLKWCKEI